MRGLYFYGQKVCLQLAGKAWVGNKVGSWGKKEGQERMVILVATRPPLHLTSGIVLLDGYVHDSKYPRS